MKKRFKMSLILGIFISLIIFSFVNVKAFGVTSPYWKERPLEMAPGEIKTVTLQLQNMVGNENVRVRAEIINGTEIAEIIDPSKEYYVPLGTKNVSVNLRIIIPSNVPDGTEYIIGIAFTTIKPGTGGGVITGMSVEKYFPVIVRTPAPPQAQSRETQPTPKTSGGLIAVLIILIIIFIILFIIWLILKKKKEEKEKVAKKKI